MTQAAFEDSRGKQEKECRILVRETKKSDDRREEKEETHLGSLEESAGLCPQWVWGWERERRTLTFLAWKPDAQFCLWLIQKTHAPAILPSLPMLQPRRICFCRRAFALGSHAASFKGLLWSVSLMEFRCPTHLPPQAFIHLILYL